MFPDMVLNVPIKFIMPHRTDHKVSRSEDKPSKSGSNASKKKELKASNVHKNAKPTSDQLDPVEITVFATMCETILDLRQAIVEQSESYWLGPFEIHTTSAQDATTEGIKSSSSKVEDHVDLKSAISRTHEDTFKIIPCSWTSFTRLDQN